MASRLFCFEEAAVSAIACRIFAYNTISGLWTTQVTGLPINTIFSSPGSACWNGTYLFFCHSGDKKLYRFDPVAGTFFTCLGGTPLYSGGENANCLASDGNYIFYSGDSGSFGRYSPSLDTIQAISGATLTSSPKIVWDFGTKLYVLNQTYTNVLNLLTLAWTTENAFAGGSVIDAAFANGKLYAWTSVATKSLIVGTAASWVAVGASAVSPVHGAQWQIDDTFAFGGFGSNTPAKLNFTAGTMSTITAAPAGCDGMGAFELPIQTSFTFYDSAGVQLSSTEVIGGALARYYSSQVVGPIQYQLQATQARTGVTLAVVPNAAVDLTSVIQLSDAAGGTYSQTLSLGDFTAGQTKSFYLKFTVPTGRTPGDRAFTLQAYSL